MKNMIHKVMMTAMMLSFTATMSAQHNQSPYTIIGNTVKYEGKAIQQADASSFQVLGYGYAKDRYNVYLDGKILRYVDPQCFRLQNNAGNAQAGTVVSSGHGHATEQTTNHGNNQGNQHQDNHNGHGNGYGNGHGNGYGQHGEHSPKYMVSTFDVYFDGKKVSSASASTFKDLGYGYGKDAFNVYYYGEKLNGASASSFVLLEGGYCKDAFDAYYRGKKISGSSGSTFTVLSNGYAKDAFNVYYCGEKVKGAMSSNFKVDGQGYAHDTFDTYYRGEKLK